MNVPANDPRDQWSVFHFSQANPEGDGQDDVPALLRRVADTIEGRGAIDVMDITFEKEITAEGPWPSLTVYYDRRDHRSND
ncbi:hypothetical protein OM076_09360 [Solirubrobacter ginsenosidimutans]|uniref:Uncharacterized protein n=1 Tax=Solirubrobacter ginsenosidimutans TaxID=490573 RepID=A0A9X3MSL6_9ACTN|nr:hypothetical protein [Solirubrobacter ginsenosidimutans]MDA0160473.1 hypothetical protein [Solirubrobacter ginsenosidimutans]